MNSERSHLPENEEKELNQEVKIDRPESSEHDDILLVVNESNDEYTRPTITSDTTSEKNLVLEQEKIELSQDGFKLNPLLSLYFSKDKAMDLLLARTRRFYDDSSEFIVPRDLVNFHSFLGDVVDLLSSKLNTTQSEEETSLSMEEKNHSNEVMNVESESTYPPELSRIFSEFLTIVLAHNAASSYFADQDIVNRAVRLWLMLVETALPVVLTQKEARSVQSGREGKLKKLEADKLAQKGMYVRFEKMFLAIMSGGGRTDHLSPSVYREEVKNAQWNVFKLMEQNSVNYDQEKYIKRNTLQRLLNLWSIPTFLDTVVAVDPSEKVIENLNNLANSCPDEFLRLLLHVFTTTSVLPETLDWLFKHITCLSNFTWLPSAEDEATRERLESLQKNSSSDAQRLRITAYSFDCMSPTFSASLLAILNLDNPYLIRLMMAANQRHEDRPLYRFIATIPPKKFEEQSNSLLNFNWLIALSGDVNFLKGPYIRENLPVHLRDKLAACLRARLALHRIFSETSSSTSEDDVEWSTAYQEMIEVSAKLQNKYVSVDDVSIKSTTKLAAAAYKETLMRLLSDYYLEPLYFCAQKWSLYEELLRKVGECVDCLGEEQLSELSKDWRFVFFLLMRFARSRSDIVASESKVDEPRYFSEQLAFQIKDFHSGTGDAISQPWIRFVFQCRHVMAKIGELSCSTSSDDNVENTRSTFSKVLSSIQVAAHLKNNKQDPLLAYLLPILGNFYIKKIFNYLSEEHLGRIFQDSGIELNVVKKIISGEGVGAVVRSAGVLREESRLTVQSLGVLTGEEVQALEALFTAKNYDKDILNRGYNSRAALYNLVLPETVTLSTYRNDTDYMRFFVCYACIQYSSEAASNKLVGMFRDVRKTDSGKKAFLFYQLFYQLFVNSDDLRLPKHREFLKQVYMKYCVFVGEKMPDVNKEVNEFWSMICRDSYASGLVGALVPTEVLLRQQQISLSSIPIPPTLDRRVLSNSSTHFSSHDNTSASTTTTYNPQNMGT